MTSAVQTKSLPPKSKSLLLLFGLYVERYLKRHFHGVRLSQASRLPELEADEPLVVYLNHPSWWDPLVAFQLTRQLFPSRRHYAPIDAEALESYGFFARLGFFGVEQGSRRGARRFLETSAAICENDRTGLWITPQGQFTDPRQRPQVLAPGLAHLIRRLDRGVVLPVALEYAFWDERLPEALVHIGEPLRIEALRTQPTARIGSRLTARLDTTADQLAQLSMQRNEQVFSTLLGGGAGVGGPYDLWRRLRARLRGEIFEPSHRTGLQNRQAATGGRTLS
jgi:1-acyl-sn-glycerol-3-phosphate acyltransferase